MPPTPLATIAQYKAGGFLIPPGVSDETITAALARASRTLRAEVRGIDERIADGTLDTELVADVVCEIVESAISSSAGPGVESIQVGTGPYQGSLKFSNPRGDMWVTSKHKRLLSDGDRRAFTVHVGPS